MNMDVHSPTAIVGLACRFPGGATSPEKLWDLIAQGRSAWGRIPRDRWHADAFYHPNPEKKGTMSVKGGHFLKENVKVFDAPFFSITPNEAKMMDPQQRMLLEVTYEAFENAGIRMEDLVGSRTSCFIGDFSSKDYERCMNRDTEESGMQQLSGNTMSILSNRLSYFFDLKGPSMTVDTACSSSLVALHLACQSIRMGESDMAIVGGVNLMLSPDMTMSLDALHLLSPEGKCFAFDRRANGYGRGEGLAVIIVKSIDAAKRDGDSTRAVIRGTGSNHDGKTRGLHLPSSEAQEQLIRQTYDNAGLTLKTTMYCEAHGTGTAAGDPLECKALAKTFGEARPSDSPLIVGSIKTNIGHLEGAAGLAGVLKVVLAFEKGLIPPNTNFEEATPRISFQESNLEVNTTLRTWPTGVRRASVNSFGFGGANVHVILEEPREFGLSPGPHDDYVLSNGSSSTNPSTPQDIFYGGLDHDRIVRGKLFCWSSHDEKGIDRQWNAYREYLSAKTEHLKVNPGQENAELALIESLSYTLARRRSELPWKSYAIASSIEELCVKVSSSSSKPVRSNSRPQLAFVFTGQGAQWYAMGRELWHYDAYRQSILDAEAYLITLGCKWSVTEELNRDAKSTSVDKAIFSQPLCTIIQVAMVTLLRYWEIRPRAVVGHSSGEIAAAYCKGVISQESAWKLAYFRGQLTNILANTKGAMMSVGLGRDEADTYLNHLTCGKAVVACINSPASVTLSGDVMAIEELEDIFMSKGIFARKLKVEIAYHSHHMMFAAEAYFQSIQDVSTVTPPIGLSVNMFSSVTGKMIDGDALGPQYWVDNLTSPVRFSDAVATLAAHVPGKQRRREKSKQFVDMWLEIGPHGSMLTPLKQTLRVDSLSYASVLERGKDSIRTALNAVGALWARGYPLDVHLANSPSGPRKDNPAMLCDAPTYSWNHSAQYWFEPRLSVEHRLRKHPRQDLLGAPVEGVSAPTWRHFLRMAENPWMEDHKVQANLPYTSAGMLVMAVQAAQQLANDASRRVSAFELQDVHVYSAMMIPPDENGIEVLLHFRPRDAENVSRLNCYDFVIDSRGPREEHWQQNCSGRITTYFLTGDTSSCLESRSLTEDDEFHSRQYEKICTECKYRKKPPLFYFELGNIGMEYGPMFYNLTAIRSRKGISCCTARVPDTASVMPEKSEYPHVIHPAFLESLMQMILPALTKPKETLKETLVGTYFGSVYIPGDLQAKPRDELPGYATASWLDTHTAEGNVVLLDAKRRHPTVVIKKMQLKGLPPVAISDGDWQPLVETSNNLRKVYSQLEWAVDPSLIQGESQMSLQDYLGYLIHKNSGLKALQYGGDAAGISTSIAQQAKSLWDPTPRISALTYASDKIDVVDEAKKVLEKWIPLAQCHSLNLEDDLGDQGFEAESYDVVFYDVVDRDAIDMNIPLSRLRRLIKTGGTLLLLQNLEPRKGTYLLSNGIGESIPDHVHPYLNITDWDRCLSQQGFTSAHTILNSPRFDEKHEKRILAASVASSSTTSANSTKVLIVFTSETHWSIQRILHDCEQKFLECGCQPVLHDLDQTIEHPLEDMLVLMLAEIPSSFLSKLTRERFEKTKQIVLRSRTLLWVTASGVITGQNPDTSLVVGFARSIRWETDFKAFATLDFDTNSDDLNEQSDTIADVIKSVGLSICSDSPRPNLDREFVYHNRSVHIPRVAPLNMLNHAINFREEPIPSDLMPVGRIGKPVRLDWGSQGDIKSLRFMEDSENVTSIQENDVEVKVIASGLNSSDHKSTSEDLGSECAGVVIRSGDKASKFNPGQRVMTIGLGCHRTLMRNTETLCQLVPDSMSFEQAACWPVAYCTAYLAIVITARLRIGESILIHSTNGDIDQAMIEVAQYCGANVYVTTETLEKRKTFSEILHVPDDHILFGGNFDFAESIMRATSDKGVDVVINSMQGEAMRKSWQCTAKFGRFVNLDTKQLAGSVDLDMRVFEKHVSLSSIDFAALLKHDRTLAAEIFESVHSLLEQGCVGAISPTASYVYSKVSEAFGATRLGHIEGKMILKAEDDDEIPLAPKIKELKLDPKASYVLVGGLGGLGRSISQWLVDHGAKSLIILSRSGIKDTDAQGFVDGLKEENIETNVFTCDVTDATRLEEVVHECASSLPPIRGVIQGAMQLRNSAFENMSHDEWLGALTPKVHGSRNLHECLPKDLDFFIMLSSVVGICGNRGQANYAAGNSYQDALAVHRRSLGLQATSIDVGWMIGVGVLEEQWAQTLRLRNSGLEGLREIELHLILEAAISGSLRGTDLSSLPPQIITGLSTGGMIERSGAMDTAWIKDAKFSYLRTIDTRHSREVHTERNVVELKRQLQEAGSLAEARAIVQAAMVDRLARSTGLDQGEIKTDQPVSALGVDSLVAIELRGWAKRELKAEVSGLDILSHIPLTEVAGKMAEASGLVDKASWAGE